MDSVQSTLIEMNLWPVKHFCPPISTDLEKNGGQKCSTGQRFTFTEVTFYKILSMLPFTDAWIKDWQLHTRIHVHCLYAAAALFIQAECRVQWGSGPNFKAFRFAWSSTVKVSRVRGPIVFGWSLLLQPKLSHKKINNIYQTHNIYLSPL